MLYELPDGSWVNLKSIRYIFVIDRDIQFHWYGEGDSIGVTSCKDNEEAKNVAAKIAFTIQNSENK